MESQPSIPQIRKLLEVVESTPQWRMQQILASGILHDLFEPNASFLDVRDSLRALLGIEGLAMGDRLLTIDYEKPFTTRLEGADLGGSPFRGDGSPNPFTIEGSGVRKLQVRAFEFGTPTSSQAALNHIKWGKSSWDPSRIEELLEIARPYHRDTISPGCYVALASIACVDGVEYVPALRITHDRNAWINLQPLDQARGKWAFDTKFLGSRLADPSM